MFPNNSLNLSFHTLFFSKEEIQRTKWVCSFMSLSCDFLHVHVQQQKKAMHVKGYEGTLTQCRIVVDNGSYMKM